MADRTEAAQVADNMAVVALAAEDSQRVADHIAAVVAGIAGKAVAPGVIA